MQDTITFTLDSVNFLRFKKIYLQAKRSGRHYVDFSGFQIGLTWANQLLTLWETRLRENGVTVIDHESNTVIIPQS